MTAARAIPALEGALEVDRIVLTPETIGLCETLDRARSHSRKRVLAIVIATHPDDVPIASAA